MSQNTFPDYYLGCDVAKLKLDVSLVNTQGIELWSDTIPNEATAIASFLLTLTGTYTGEIIQCVVEATGTYHLAYAETSHAVGLLCRIYNPIITKSGIKSTARGKKTDRTDALVIA